MKVRPTRAVWLLLAGGLAFGAVSRTTGAGWLVVLVAIVAGLIVVGAVGPWLLARRLTIDVRAGADAVSGRPVDLSVVMSDGPAVVDLPDFFHSFGATAAGDGVVTVVPHYRGVYRTLRVVVTVAAPLGLVKVAKETSVDLGRPLVVRPAARNDLVVDALAGLNELDGDPSAGMAHEGTVASLSEYTAGDPMRRIHWAASARHGDLLVKRLEPPHAPRLVVVAELSGGRDAQEELAGRALGVVVRGLAAGVQVELWTKGPGGVSGGTIHTPVQAGRRLAEAIPGRVVGVRSMDGAKVVVVAAT